MRWTRSRWLERVGTLSRALASAVAAVAASAALAGCTSNMCLLTVNGRCEWSTCPDGAQFDGRSRRCVCRAGRIAFDGACLTVAQANEVCGKGYHFERGGCVPNTCPPGLTIDQETGTCLTPLQAAAVANNMGVQVGQNQKLGCPPGELLVVEGQQAACVPATQTCGRDEQWDGRQCLKVVQCPPGSTYDAASRMCVQFATEAAAHYTVRLDTWLATQYGPNGSDGKPGFCSAFGKHPLAFGVPSGKSQRVRILVQVQAPNRNLRDSFVLASGLMESTLQAVPAKGAAEIQQAAEVILSPLKTGGGDADAVMATTTVSCPVVNSSKPTVVTVAGGA